MTPSSLGGAIPIRSTSRSPPRKLLSKPSHVRRASQAGLSPSRCFRSKSLSRRPRAHIFFGLISFGVVLAAAASSVGLRFNLTSSLPIGLYRVTKDSPTLKRGAIVLYCLPPPVARFAHNRGYVPRGGQCPSGLTPIGKMVAALPGDTVVVTTDGITVNGALQSHSRALATDLNGRELPQLVGRSYVIGRDCIWLLAPSERSFDSRYLGPLVARNVLARVQPVWIAAAR
jgi:conjugative transfer signal peptidase TraF